MLQVRSANTSSFSFSFAGAEHRRRLLVVGGWLCVDCAKWKASIASLAAADSGLDAYRFVTDTLCVCAVGHALATARAAGGSAAALMSRRCVHCKQRSHHPTEFACTQCAFDQVTASAHCTASHGLALGCWVMLNS